MSTDAKQCPWCARWCLKDAACNYIFACGLQTNGRFEPHTGCGRPWCWQCGKKFCGVYVDPATGARSPGARDSHTATCCKNEAGFVEAEYCPGGHNSHCDQRW